jgi:hypothetical protein
MLDQLGTERSAAAVAQENMVVGGHRQRAGKVLYINRG